MVYIEVYIMVYVEVHITKPLTYNSIVVAVKSYISSSNRLILRGHSCSVLFSQCTEKLTRKNVSLR